MFNGTTDAAIHAYLQSPKTVRADAPNRPWGRGTHTAVRAVRLLDAGGDSTAQYIPGQPLRVEVELETDGAGGMSLEVFLRDTSRAPIGMASSYQFHGQMLPTRQGVYVCRLDLEPMWLASGSYTLDARTSAINVGWDHDVEEALEFDVPFSNPLGRELDFKQTYGFGPFAMLSSPPVRFDSIPENKGATLYDDAGEKVH